MFNGMETRSVLTAFRRILASRLEQSSYNVWSPIFFLALHSFISNWIFLPYCFFGTSSVSLAGKDDEERLFNSKRWIQVNNLRSLRSSNKDDLSKIMFLYAHNAWWLLPMNPFYCLRLNRIFTFEYFSSTVGSRRTGGKRSSSHFLDYIRGWLPRYSAMGW